jgi:hypothetical protein
VQFPGASCVILGKAQRQVALALREGAVTPSGAARAWSRDLGGDGYRTEAATKYIVQTLKRLHDRETVNRRIGIAISSASIRRFDADQRARSFHSLPIPGRIPPGSAGLQPGQSFPSLRGSHDRGTLQNSLRDAGNRDGLVKVQDMVRTSAATLHDPPTEALILHPGPGLRRSP